MNKRKVKFIAILLIIISLLLVGYSMAKNYGRTYNNTNRNVIIGFVYADKEEDKEYNKPYTLATGLEVETVQFLR